MYITMEFPVSGPSFKVMAFEALFPSLPIILLEYILFFYITLDDVHRAKQNEFQRIRNDIEQQLQQLPLSKRNSAIRYLKNVHQTVQPDYDLYQADKKEHTRQMKRRGQIVMAMVACSILIAAVIVFREISWSSLGLQTIVNTILIGAFQVFFYFQIGKKYNYSS